MTTLIFVRHGQSMANFTKSFAGHLDVDLSDLGRQQAILAAEYIAKNYWYIYTCLSVKKGLE